MRGAAIFFVPPEATGSKAAFRATSVALTGIEEAIVVDARTYCGVLLRLRHAADARATNAHRAPGAGGRSRISYT